MRRLVRNIGLPCRQSNDGRAGSLGRWVAGTLVFSGSFNPNLRIVEGTLDIGLSQRPVPFFASRASWKKDRSWTIVSAP